MPLHQPDWISCDVLTQRRSLRQALPDLVLDREGDSRQVGETLEGAVRPAEVIQLPPVKWRLLVEVAELTLEELHLQALDLLRGRRFDYVSMMAVDSNLPLQARMRLVQDAIG